MLAEKLPILTPLNLDGLAGFLPVLSYRLPKTLTLLRRSNVQSGGTRSAEKDGELLSRGFACRISSHVVRLIHSGEIGQKDPRVKRKENEL